MDDVNGEGSDPGKRRVRLLVGINMYAQTKVELAHPVVTGFVGPHRGKYLSNEAYILLHRLLPYGVFPCGYKAGADELIKKMEGWSWVIDVSEVWATCIQPHNQCH